MVKRAVFIERGHGCRWSQHKRTVIIAVCEHPAVLAQPDEARRIGEAFQGVTDYGAVVCDGSNHRCPYREASR